MKVLIIGGGGREHALAWKCAQSPRVRRVFVAPGNAGTAREPKVANVAIGAEDIAALVAFARRQQIELTIVGPEAPLVAGVVDAFERAGLKCFGPRANAAILEASKVFTKDFFKRHGIPTAAYESFTDLAAAKAYIRSRALPLVVKASGLAAGKGVIIAHTQDEALSAARDMLAGKVFGAAGSEIVVEEFLEGEEASFIVMTDGKTILPFPSAQDHKAVFDGDQGPNTGGMGAYSPAPIVDAALHARVIREIIEPTLAGMAAEGRPYVGFLYAGLMIGKDGTPKTLEYNCRFGDPETQPIMMRLRSDLPEACLAVLNGEARRVKLEFDPRAAVGVVLVAGGYPGDYAKGRHIEGLDADLADTHVFHAGTAAQDGQVVTSGGRVLCVVGVGRTVCEAQAKAYERVDRIRWDGMHCRRDIGHRAVAREARS
ncbi:MAG TPA: phosphoribosylamine--glycine ligase [Gammaproteobacteria bacterium]|nr:phosphoribosylamine--glycine ligase [Gammaproteobacteria bacterium]